MRSLIVSIVLLVSSVAAAQPGLTAPVAATAKPTGPKQQGNGYLLSALGSVAPVLILAAFTGGDADSAANGVMLAGAAAILTPSAGHWYAGKFATTGMGIRLISGGVATLGLVLATQSDEAISNTHAHLILGGMIGVGIGAVWDMATVGSAVDDWNLKHAQVAPTVMKTGDGYGVGLVGSF